MLLSRRLFLVLLSSSKKGSVALGDIKLDSGQTSDALRVADKYSVPDLIGALTWAPVAGGMLTNKYLADVDFSTSRFQIPFIAITSNHIKYFGPET